MISRRMFVAFAFAGLVFGSSLHAADDKKLPRCYFDVTADGKKLGRPKNRTAGGIIE